MKIGYSFLKIVFNMDSAVIYYIKYYMPLCIENHNIIYNLNFIVSTSDISILTV